jgi:hypothetical protein
MGRSTKAKRPFQVTTRTLQFKLKEKDRERRGLLNHLTLLAFKN